MIMLTENMVIAKIRKAIDEGGLDLLAERSVRFLYFQIYNFLPKTTTKYNGIEVYGARLFEKNIPRNNPSRPKYEEGIINALERNVENGDEIKIIGGGLGVTAVKSASLSGNPSNVEVFEGAEERIEKMRQTFKLHNLQDIRINHAIVGPEIDVWGSTESASRVEPQELSECDILEIDCEGSEKEILKNLEIMPRVIIVESHGHLNSSTEDLKEILKQLGYKIKNVEPAENKDYVKEKDIKVITAVDNN
ncbi:MAG: FkbM family methyltransferase [Candidatus Nanohaloarchaea archaeon]